VPAAPIEAGGVPRHTAKLLRAVVTGETRAAHASAQVTLPVLTAPFLAAVREGGAIRPFKAGLAPAPSEPTNTALLTAAVSRAACLLLLLLPHLLVPSDFANLTETNLSCFSNLLILRGRQDTAYSFRVFPYTNNFTLSTLADGHLPTGDQSSLCHHRRAVTTHRFRAPLANPSLFTYAGAERAHAVRSAALGHARDRTDLAARGAVEAWCALAD